jgi:hypothetical protein
MIDELMKHRYELRKLNLAAEYLRDLIANACNGKDGYGPNTKQLIQEWLVGLHESLESFEQVYCNIYQILNSRD